MVNSLWKDRERDAAMKEMLNSRDSYWDHHWFNIRLLRKEHQAQNTCQNIQVFRIDRCPVMPFNSVLPYLTHL